MAEIAGHVRGRARGPERLHTAIAQWGALPQRQRDTGNPWALWRGGNDNRNGPTPPTRFERETKLITKLLRSGKVHNRELCSYRTPDILLGQGDDIDPLNVELLEIANNMACTRRVILDLKLMRKAKSQQVIDLEHQLAVWPADVQQLQGQIEDLGGRALLIPSLLFTPVDLEH